MKVVRIFQLVGKGLEDGGDNRIENRVRPCNRKTCAKRAELKLIAGKGEGGCAVAVGGIFGDGRKHVNANRHFRSAFVVVGAAVFDGFKDSIQLIAEIDRNNCRRRFVRPKAAVVTCGGDGNAQ